MAPPDPALIDDELALARAAVAAATDPLERLRRNRDVVRDFGGLRDVDAETDAVARLEADPAVKKQRAREEKLAKAELSYMPTRFTPWLARMLDRDRPPPSVKESLVTLGLGSLRTRDPKRVLLLQSSGAWNDIKLHYMYYNGAHGDTIGPSPRPAG